MLVYKLTLLVQTCLTNNRTKSLELTD